MRTGHIGRQLLECFSEVFPRVEHWSACTQAQGTPQGCRPHVSIGGLYQVIDRPGKVSFRWEYPVPGPVFELADAVACAGIQAAVPGAQKRFGHTSPRRPVVVSGARETACAEIRNDLAQERERADRSGRGRDTVDKMPAPLARDPQSGPSLWFLAPFKRVPLPAWAIGRLISFAIMALCVAIEIVYLAAGATARPLWPAER